MPLLAGASPVAIAAVAAGVMLGKTETASQTASPRSAIAARCGASPSRMAARSTSGLMPSSTRSRAGLGVWLPVSIESGLFYSFIHPQGRTVSVHHGAVGASRLKQTAKRLDRFAVVLRFDSQERQPVDCRW